MVKKIIAACCLLLLSGAAAIAQEFDAASVRLNTLDDHIVRIDVGPGRRFTARGYTLKLLIQRAYGMKGFQLSGGPAWMDTDRYDIVATAPVSSGGTLTEEQLKPMLRALLTARFALKVHTAGKEMPGFGLIVAGSNPKMKISAATKEQPDLMRDACGYLVANGMTMKTFAVMLGSYLSKPVEDETGLPGLYDIKVRWTERADQMASPADAQSDDQPVTLIAALRDQMGLRLRSRRLTANTLIIDSAEKATAN